MIIMSVASQESYASRLYRELASGSDASWSRAMHHLAYNLPVMCFSLLFLVAGFTGVQVIAEVGRARTEVGLGAHS